MKWRDCSLGDVMTLQRGHDLPESQRQLGDVPVATSSGITGRHNEAKAKAPGVITGRYGTLGVVSVPLRFLLTLFNDAAEPVFQQIKVLHTQNQKLRAARDLLLPRLMSGEVAV